MLQGVKIRLSWLEASMNSFVKEKLASQAKFVMPFAPVVLSAVLYTSIQVWVVIQGFGDRSYRPKDPRQSVQNLASSPSE